MRQLLGLLGRTNFRWDLGIETLFCVHSSIFIFPTRLFMSLNIAFCVSKNSCQIQPLCFLPTTLLTLILLMLLLLLFLMLILLWLCCDGCYCCCYCYCNCNKYCYNLYYYCYISFCNGIATSAAIISATVSSVVITTIVADTSGQWILMNRQISVQFGGNRPSFLLSSSV